MEQDEATRNARGQFVKGSGNPRGRPKIPVDVIQLARAATPEAMATLVRVLSMSDYPSAQVAAAKVLLDRGWGQSPAVILIPGEKTLPEFAVRSIDDDDSGTAESLQN